MKDLNTIIETILQESLHTYRRKNSKAPLKSLTEARRGDAKHKKGAVAVVRSKADLSAEQGVKGYVITSRETLLEDAPDLTHWTPNPYNYLEYSDTERRHIKGHFEKNLQQINTFVVDIDSKEQPYTGILTAALDHSIGVPTLVLETPKGFQAYFVLETPLFIHSRNDYRGLSVAKRIAENLRKSLQPHIFGVDVACNDFGFFRMPNEDNVRWFSRDMRYSMHNLIAWSQQQDDNHGRTLFTANKEQDTDPTDAEWFRALLTTKDVKGESGQIGRDNLMYTLALACYRGGKAEQATLDLLDEYNTALTVPLRHSEVRKIVNSAYKGRFHGPHTAYICDLLDAWLPNRAVTVERQGGGWYKHKKARSERTRSHYDEWEQDILRFIESETSLSEPVTWGTQRSLCEKLGMPRSTFNELLRKSKQILVKRTGKGRNAQTGLTSVAVLLRCAIDTNRQHRDAYYAAVRLMTGEPDNQNALWELENRLSALTWTPPNRGSTGKIFNSS